MSSPTSSVVPSWLLKAKVSTPEPGGDHVPRAALRERLDGVLARRFALLQAPAGFGKTTVLADFIRGKRVQGLVAAWISLDEDDAPDVFGSYLAYAFEQAGLDLSVVSDLDAWSSSPASYQIGMLARAVDLHAAPCLLALDEIDRLPRETVDLVQRLVDQGPRNLHLVLACRSNPGLDLAMHAFRESGTVVGAEAFRFSRADIGRFFRGSLSRRQLVEMEERTDGWPVALLLHRNLQTRVAGRPAGETSKLTADFVGRRLLRGLSREDRTFVCELAVFDWIDTRLVDEVLGSPDAQVRIKALTQLDGLLSPVGETGEVRRLHPLVRDCCVDLLAREDPARKRALHAGIARTLAHRGQLAAAWRHAAAAGDPGVVVEILEGAGVFELWLRHGVTMLASTAEFLTSAVTAPYPRLALLRSLALHLRRTVDQAEALYESVSRRTGGFSRDRDGGDAGALAVDGFFTRVMLDGGSSRALHDEIDTLLPAGAAEDDERGRLVLGLRHMAFCDSCYERARFDECRRHAVLARTHFGDERPYGNIVLDVYVGMAAMARGLVREAAECYARARRGMRKDFFSDPCLAVCVDAVTLELDLERNREKAVQPRTLKSLAELRAVWTDVDAAVVAVSAELTFERDRNAVVPLLAETLDDVRGLRPEALSRFVSGLLVFYLAAVGRADEAARAWRDHGLPDDIGELLDLDRQPWRTIESMACARARLLSGQGDFAGAEEVAGRLSAVASERGLLRAELRGLALSMAAAARAGEADRAQARLVEFLGRAREAGYLRPLVREREVAEAALRRLLDGGPDALTRDAAESALAQVTPRRPAPPTFSQRELEVLAEVREGLRNREIAVRLGISQPGVRFHLANIYRKTGVNRREEAVRSAQSLGVLD